MEVLDLAVLPLLGFAVCVATAARLLGPRTSPVDARAVLMVAALGWGVAVTGLTQGLSLFSELNRVSLAIGWVILTASGAASVLFVPGRTWRLVGVSLALSESRGHRLARVFIFAGLAAVVSGTLMVAVVAAPNNWDSMTYHLSRVEQWASRASVAHYATSITRQLYEPPWSEYAILQFRILAGNDAYSNLVQWGAMIVSACGVSLIGRQLGANRVGQVTSAVFAITLPMGVLQATSTQTDYTVALWLVVATYFAIEARSGVGPFLAAGVGAAVGLALLTKGTAYFYSLPALACVGWSAWRHRTAGRLWYGAFGIAGACVLALNAWYWGQNIALFHAALGSPTDTAAYENAAVTPRLVVSNLIRNLVLQMGTPSAQWNYHLERLVGRIHHLLGVSPDDPRTTWPGTRFHVNPLSRHEDSAGNPLHFALLTAAGAVICGRRKVRSPELVVYGASVLGAFLLTIIFLRWQPWNSRLQLPVFVLFAPFVGTLAGRFSHAVPYGLCALLLAASAPWVLDNGSRPLIGAGSVLTVPRESQYFANRPELADAYRRVDASLASDKCRQLGLVSREDDWEYPLWVLPRVIDHRSILVRDVLVSNSTSQLKTFAPFRPCAVVALFPLDKPPVIEGLPYRLRSVSDGVSYYTPVPTSP